MKVPPVLHVGLLPAGRTSKGWWLQASVELCATLRSALQMKHLWIFILVKLPASLLNINCLLYHLLQYISIYISIWINQRSIYKQANINTVMYQMKMNVSEMNPCIIEVPCCVCWNSMIPWLSLLHSTHYRFPSTFSVTTCVVLGHGMDSVGLHNIQRRTIWNNVTRNCFILNA